ncbi:MAG: hypothetical protein IKH57_17205 [Clostridia bacterium]|nr:hypothetical protein [Clostridia bacterium]
MQSAHEKLLLFDLADPEKRTKDNILEALKIIHEYQKTFRVVLGLNAREASHLCALLENTVSDMEDAAAFLREAIGVDTVVIHGTKRAAAAQATEVQSVDGPYCREPKLSTGAGDHFNAGFMYSMIQQDALKESLLNGVANSGYYVRYGASPTTEQLKDFRIAWQNGSFV